VVTFDALHTVRANLAWLAGTKKAHYIAVVKKNQPLLAHHHTRDVTFREDTAASRTGNGPANLATIRAAVIAAIKDAGYLHVPEGRRDHTTPAEALRLHRLE
jgi:predicted transposase YbfD/YdcC